MNATQTRVEPNDLGYYEVDAKGFRPMGDRILVDWEHTQDEIVLGNVKLVKHEKYKKLHYTGTVIAVGPDVEDERIKPGVRILFDQFSNFEKFWDPELGRLALISERQQASAFAIIPARVKVGSGEPDYNYDAG
jgi:co-chaperonin GroES (HSP10)